MISFHKAEAADRVWAHEILKNCEYPGAEYAFSCMYLWSDYFGELGRVGDHLTQHASWRGREVYLYPAGAGDIKGAIEAIRADAAERGGPLRLRSLTKDKKEELEALYPGKFEFTACRNSYDYIYTVEELSELHGKKLQSKRNHCNRFEDEFPDWFTAPITDDNLPQCHEMLRVWYETHEPAVNAQELDQLQLEKAALQRAFDHFDIEQVCAYDAEKQEQLMQDPGIIRNRRKIAAAVNNARIFRDIQDSYGSFADYLWGWTAGEVIVESGISSSALSDAISADLKRRGMKFVGTTIIYAYLQAVGVIDAHEESCAWNRKNKGE